MCSNIIFENLTQTCKHRLIDLFLTRLPQHEFHYISSHLPKSLKEIMQAAGNSVLLSNDETSAYFMEWEHHFD